MKLINKTPLLSVVMPVKNGEKYLDEAIKSVLIQSYKYFEFIIINDGSTDNTSKIIEKYIKTDNRIKLFSFKNGSGISAALNFAIKKAKGKYIVRTDGDDICNNNRFETQVRYLNSHPDVDVLGTYFCTFVENQKNKCVTVPCYSNNIKKGHSPVHHPTCMIKKGIFNKYGYYNSKYDNAEDVDLWFRWYSKGVRFDNIPEVLYKKRIHTGSVSVYKIRHQVFLLLKINLTAIFKYKILYSFKGYVYVAEQLLYFIYLSLHLDKIYARNKIVNKIKLEAEN